MCVEAEKDHERWAGVGNRIIMRGVRWYVSMIGGYISHNNYKADRAASCGDTATESAR